MNRNIEITLKTTGLPNGKISIDYQITQDANIKTVLGALHSTTELILTAAENNPLAMSISELNLNFQQS